MNRVRDCGAYGVEDGTDVRTGDVAALWCSSRPGGGEPSSQGKMTTGRVHESWRGLHEPQDIWSSQCVPLLEAWL